MQTGECTSTFKCTQPLKTYTNTVAHIIPQSENSFYFPGSFENESRELKCCNSIQTYKYARTQTRSFIRIEHRIQSIYILPYFYIQYIYGDISCVDDVQQNTC